MSEFTPEEQEAVVVADPKRPYKAYVSAGLSAVVTFVGIWIADTDPFTMKEAAGAAVAGLVASGIVGVPTYYTSNPTKVKVL